MHFFCRLIRLRRQILWAAVTQKDAFRPPNGKLHRPMVFQTLKARRRSVWVAAVLDSASYDSPNKSFQQTWVGVCLNLALCPAHRSLTCWECCQPWQLNLQSQIVCLCVCVCFVSMLQLYWSNQFNVYCNSDTDYDKCALFKPISQNKQHETHPAKSKMCFFVSWWPYYIVYI